MTDTNRKQAGDPEKTALQAPAPTDPAAETPVLQPPPAKADSPQSEKEQDDAFKKLRRAVGKKVSERSDEIAKSLVQHAIDGNSNTARIVVGIVDKKKRTKSELKRLKKAALETKPVESTALNLAKDELWTDDDDKDAGDPERCRKKGRDADEKH
jgi:hypothetical protein